MMPAPPADIVFDPHVVWALATDALAFILVLLCLVPPDKR
jgi:hypothetical protein